MRRGDALGLRALADQFADAVAPDLSNRVRDGRWVTILAWCLARSQEVFHASGGRSMVTRTEQRQRYAWLRPLELMWVARTIALAEDWRDRSLAGQRRVRPWYEDDATIHRSLRDVGGPVPALPADWHVRRIPARVPQVAGHDGAGDGWTPGPATLRLAKWLDEKLGAARPPWPLHVGRW